MFKPTEILGENLSILFLYTINNCIKILYVVFSRSCMYIYTVHDYYVCIVYLLYLKCVLVSTAVRVPPANHALSKSSPGTISYFIDCQSVYAQIFLVQKQADILISKNQALQILYLV